jgi:hypothetical protein
MSASSPLPQSTTRYRALRNQAWLAASDPSGSLRLPLDSTAQSSRSRQLPKLRKPWPILRTHSMRRFTASVGPLETPVVRQARTSASQAEICGGEPADLGHLGVGSTTGRRPPGNGGPSGARRRRRSHAAAPWPAPRPPPRRRGRRPRARPPGGPSPARRAARRRRAPRRRMPEGGSPLRPRRGSRSGGGGRRRRRRTWPGGGHRSGRPPRWPARGGRGSPLAKAPGGDPGPRREGRRAGRGRARPAGPLPPWRSRPATTSRARTRSGSRKSATFRAGASGVAEQNLAASSPSAGGAGEVAGVFHQRPGLVGVGRHQQVPADPEGRRPPRGGRVAVPAHPPGRSRPGPARLRTARGRIASPVSLQVLDLAVRLGAAPGPLGPRRHHRAAGDRGVPH